MLNNHQWQEIKNCKQRKNDDIDNNSCDTCSIQQVCLSEELGKYHSMLEKLQFVENRGMIGGAIYKFCPVCGNANIQGHKENCELAKLLRTGEENAEFIMSQRK